MSKNPITWITKEIKLLAAPTHRKYAVSAVAFAGEVIDLGLVHGTIAHNLGIIIALAGTIGVRAVKNTNT